MHAGNEDGAECETPTRYLHLVRQSSCCRVPRRLPHCVVERGGQSVGATNSGPCDIACRIQNRCDEQHLNESDRHHRPGRAGHDGECGRRPQSRPVANQAAAEYHTTGDRRTHQVGADEGVPYDGHDETSGPRRSCTRVATMQTPRPLRWCSKAGRLEVTYRRVS